jgi:uncharacterized protein YcgI (DUF1989 family)
MAGLRIPPKRGAAVELSPGEEVSVIDPEGDQVADLVAFDPSDERVRLSTKYTMRQAGRLRVTTGDRLYSTAGEPMLEIVGDDCGIHDLLFAPCNHWILDEYGQPGDRGCRENLAEALSEWDVPEHLVQEPMNVFMRTTVTDHEFVDVREPVSEPGDAVTFRATDDVVVAVSACATEATVNAGTAGPIDLRVPDGASPNTNF